MIDEVVFGTRVCQRLDPLLPSRKLVFKSETARFSECIGSVQPLKLFVEMTNPRLNAPELEEVSVEACLALG